jgi:hypothetical protein
MGEKKETDLVYDKHEVGIDPGGCVYSRATTRRHLLMQNRRKRSRTLSNLALPPLFLILIPLKISIDGHVSDGSHCQ